MIMATPAIMVMPRVAMLRAQCLCNASISGKRKSQGQQQSSPLSRKKWAAFVRDLGHFSCHLLHFFCETFSVCLKIAKFAVAKEIKDGR